MASADENLRPTFELVPRGAERPAGAIAPLAQSGGRLLGAVVGEGVCTWLEHDGQLVLMVWPATWRARFGPLELLDDRGDVVARGGELVTVAGGYLKPGDVRALGYEEAFAAWKVSADTSARAS